MRVLIVMRGESIVGGGGAERRFGRLFAFFAANADPDFNVMLVVNKALAEGLIASRIVERDAEGLIHPEEDMGIPAFNRWLIRTVRHHQPDVVHLVLIQKSLLPFYLWLRANEPVVVVSTLASANLALDGKCSLMDSAVARIVWDKSRTIDSLYPGTEASLRLRRWRRRIRISPCSFTDYSQYRPSPAKANAIVFAGRLIEGKNPMLLVRAIERINHYAPTLFDTWKVAMYGDGPLKKHVISGIDDYGLGSIVTVGCVDSMSSVLSESRVFVSLQSVDNYPSQSLLEAMACENLVIATDVGNTRLLVNESTGILVDTSVHSLSEALCDVMHSWDAYAPRANRARLHAMEAHSIDRFASYLRNIWTQAATSSPARARMYNGGY